MTKPFNLGLSHSELEYLGGYHTAREISQQPELWLGTFDAFASQQNEANGFLEKIYSQRNLRIILTGAGTSAFIGNILQGSFQKNTHQNVWAVATTDLVSHPRLYLDSSAPTLVISFARSGNSPESIAAIDLVNSICENPYHFFITCNPHGKLALKNHDNERSFLFTLPPAADDQSLAMTGSFTSMLLTGLLLSRIRELEKLKDQVKRLANYGQQILKLYTDPLRNIAQLDFERAVFLGSGPLLGTARESQLKLQELTDGKVICKYDSFLGFRHGPKAVINSSTLLIYLFSNNSYAHQYEMDLVKTINNGERGMSQIGIFESKEATMPLDLEIILSNDKEKIDEEFLAICCVLPAQILSFFKSLNLGLQPDSPSVNQTITRVVQGVVIYPFATSNGYEKKANH